MSQISFVIFLTLELKILSVLPRCAVLITKIEWSPYSTGNRVHVGYPMQMKSTPKKLNVHGQRKRFALRTQRNLYSTGSRWGFALGDVKNLCHPTQNSGVGCIAQRQPPTPGILRGSGI